MVKAKPKTGPRPRPKPKAMPRQMVKKLKVKQTPKRKPRARQPTLDPRDESVYPTPFPMGTAVAINSVARLNFQVTNTVDVLVVVTMSSPTEIFAWWTPYIPSDGGSTYGGAAIVAPQLSSSGYTSQKTGKVGVSVCNATKQLDVAGTVAVYEAPQRLPINKATVSAMLGTDWADLASNVRANAKTKIFSGAHFIEPKHYHSKISDWSNYSNFQSKTTASANVDTYTGVWAAPNGGTVHQRDMTTTVLHFASTSVTQDYILTFRGQTLTRHAAESVLASVAKPIPVRVVQNSKNTLVE